MTYLIQNNNLHFYSRENIHVSFPNTTTIHTNDTWAKTFNKYKCNKIYLVPFKLNTAFIHYKQ